MKDIDSSSEKDSRIRGRMTSQRRRRSMRRTEDDVPEEDGLGEGGR